MSEPVYLVDGSGYIFRAFYATPTMSNSKGLPTNAIYAFTRMIIKLLKDTKAAHIAVMFDTKEPTFRHELYSEYKANRDECPEDLVPQMPYFRKVIQELGLSCYEQAGVEADDIIATLTKELSGHGEKVVIVSGDKDLLQLVDENVSVFDAMKNKVYDPEAVREKMGVPPELVRDFLTLTGDSSDNVPGVKGVGPKTACALLNALGDLEAVMADPAKIEEIDGLRGKSSVRKKIESGVEDIHLSRELVSLKFDVDPYVKIQNSDEIVRKEIDGKLLGELFSELEFKNLMDGIKDIGGSLEMPGADYKEKDYQIITEESFEGFVKELSSKDAFAFDTETTSLDVLDCRLIGISFSFANAEAFYLPVSEDEKEGFFTLSRVREALGPVFADENIKKSGLNLKYDIGVLESSGFEVKGDIFDSMLASYLLHPDIRQHGLKALAQKYLGERMVSYKEMLGDAETIEEVDLERLGHYACHDADMSWSLESVLKEELGEDNDAPGLSYVFNSIEMPLVRVLADMEREGIAVDVDYLDELSVEFLSELEKLEGIIHELAGKEFNINSPKQLSAILFEDLGIPTKGIKKKTAYYSTDATTLAKLSEEYEIAERLLDYREIHKLQTTYVEGLKRLVHHKTGRIHTSFNQAVTATGRLSSSDPNLQNIPIRGERGRTLRKVFISKDACKLVSADYSQIELRVLAHLSGDKRLTQAFLNGEDIHMATARELFGNSLPFDQDEKDQRRIAKTINFGVIYGISSFRLANQLGVTRREAQDFIDNYYNRYPGIREYFDEIDRLVDQQGWIETLYGRRRVQADIDTSGRDRGYLKRSLMNFPMQGTAADIIKIAMNSLHKELENQYSGQARMVLQVHDELVFEVDNEVLEGVCNLVVDQMEHAVTLDVPLTVDYKVGHTWSESE